MDRFGEMETFARVVESGSFSRAARDLHMTPSAVSKMIGRLEDRLGVRLLSRTTRKLSLTEEGRAFYQRVTPILAEVEEAEETVSLSTAEARGVLKVNSSTAFGQYQIVPLIPGILEKYPSLQVQLTMTDSIVNLVEEGYDVSVRIGTLTDSSLIARKLGVAHRVLVAAPSYLERHGRPTCPEDLKDHECLKLSIPTSLNKWEFTTADGPRTVEVKGRFEADNAIALHEAALAGIGLSDMRAWMAHERARGVSANPMSYCWAAISSSISLRCRLCRFASVSTISIDVRDSPASMPVKTRPSSVRTV